MNTNKKIHEEKVKEFRSVFNEQLKCFDLISELNRSAIFEISEYCKRRSEIEAEYYRNLNKQSEKFADRLEKIKQTFKITESNDQLKSGSLVLMNILLSEANAKASVSQQVSEHFISYLSQLCTKYNEICAFKLSQVKEIHNNLSEEIISELSTVFEKRYFYFDAFSSEARSNRKFVLVKEKESKSKKSGKQGQEKIEKCYSNFLDSIQKTDSCRNMYIIHQHSLQGILDRLTGQQIPDLVLLLNYKFGDFASSFTKAFCDGVTKKYDAYMDQIKKYEELKFSDVVESDTAIERSSRTLVDTNLKIPLITVSNDLVTGLMLSGRVKDEMIELKDNTQKRCLELVESMSDVSLEVMKIQDSPLDWAKLIKTSDITKGSKVRSSIPDIFNPYYKRARAYITNDMNLYLLKTQLNKITGTLESPFAPQKTRIPKPDKKRVREDLFSMDLQDYYKETSEKIPDILISCVKYIYDYKGYTLQGIFRISSSSAQFNAIKDCLLDGEEVEKLDVNVFAIANILKQFLRGLKNIFPPDVLKECLSEETDKAKLVEIARSIFEKLPIPSKELLLFLFKFLNFISINSDKNKMDASNLSIVFGPTIFACQVDSADAVKTQNIANAFIRNLIESIYEIFPNEPPLFETEEVPENEVVTVDVHDLEQDELYSSISFHSGAKEDFGSNETSSPNFGATENDIQSETRFNPDMPSFGKISSSSCNESVECIKQIKRSLSIGNSSDPDILTYKVDVDTADNDKEQVLEDVKAPNDSYRDDAIPSPPPTDSDLLQN